MFGNNDDCWRVADNCSRCFNWKQRGGGVEIGNDLAQNTKTQYTEIAPSVAQTEVYLTVDDSGFIASLPTSVILSGTPDAQGKYIGKYSIKATGNMSGNKIISITPDNTNIPLTQRGKTDKSAIITQAKTKFTSDDLKNSVSTNGTITADKLTAGSWNSSFNFNIKKEDSDVWYDVTDKIDILNNGDVGRWDTDGLFRDFYEGAHTINIPVRAGEKYRVSGSAIDFQALALVRTNLGYSVPDYTLLCVGGKNDAVNGIIQDKVITIPQGAHWLCLSTNDSQIGLFKIEKYNDNQIDISKNYSDEKLAWNYDKVYMTITVDDTDNDLNEVVALSKQCDVPLSFATCPERINEKAKDGQIKKDLLLEAQANGCEILLHGNSVLTSRSTYSDYRKFYVDNKKKLENAGFVINGVIMAGGEDQFTQDFDLGTKMAYENGFLYGDYISTNNIYNKRFFNPRKFMDNQTVKQCTDKIDEAINKGSGWIHFAVHLNNRNSMDINQLKQVIEYAQQKGVTITTWNNVYNQCAVNK